MDGTASPPVARDATGRFQPGVSGNPAGKRPGTRNRRTLLAEALREGEEAALARSIIVGPAGRYGAQPPCVIWSPGADDARLGMGSGQAPSTSTWRRARWPGAK